MKYVCLFISISFRQLSSCILVAFTVCVNKQLEALEETQALPAFEQIIFYSAPEPGVIIILPC